MSHQKESTLGEFCISKSYIDLTFPFAIPRSKAYIGDCNSIIEFIVVMVGMEGARIHQDAP
ncbi:hypothetical protein BHU11_03540 [Tannerella sp. oral taxon 808]|nr:hypothetical protein BHU11_03540 [Tannerella sp. oral taxon 808]